MENIFREDPLAIHECAQYEVFEFDPNPKPLRAEELEEFLGTRIHFELNIELLKKPANVVDLASILQQSIQQTQARPKSEKAAKKTQTERRKKAA